MNLIIILHTSLSFRIHFEIFSKIMYYTGFKFGLLLTFEVEVHPMGTIGPEDTNYVAIIIYFNH